MNKNYITGFLSGTTFASLGLVALLMGSGFQGANAKTGVVDGNKVSEQIQVEKGLQTDLRNFFNERKNVLDFLNQNRLLKKDEADKFVTLSLKATKTEAEKTELEKIKTTAATLKKSYNDLQVKAEPSPADLKLLDDYRNRMAEMGEFLNAKDADFKTEFDTYKATKSEVLQKAYAAALEEIGKKDGYTVIFERTFAPYAANDVTDAVAKAAAKKN